MPTTTRAPEDRVLRAPDPAPRRAARGRRWRSNLTAYGYLSPTLVVMLVMMAVPVVMVFVYSTLSNVVVERDPEFVGLQNYMTLLGDEVFRKALWQTGVFTVVSVTLHLAIGMAFAMMLNSTLVPRWASAVYRVIYILPWVFTASIVVIVWQLLLNPNGVVNYLLELAHLIDTKVEWFSDPDLALGTVIFINVWAGYPFIMISLLAGLQGIPSELYEAAEIDGAGARARFVHVTIPQLLPILLAVAMLDFIWNLQQFPIIFLATGGGPLNATETISTLTYNLAFSKREFAMAAASGAVLFLVSAVVALFYVRRQKARD